MGGRNSERGPICWCPGCVRRPLARWKIRWIRRTAFRNAHGVRSILFLRRSRPWNRHRGWGTLWWQTCYKKAFETTTCLQLTTTCLPVCLPVFVSAVLPHFLNTLPKKHTGVQLSLCKHQDSTLLTTQISTNQLDRPPTLMTGQVQRFQSVKLKHNYSLLTSKLKPTVQFVATVFQSIFQPIFQSIISQPCFGSTAFTDDGTYAPWVFQGPIYALVTINLNKFF